MDNTEKKITDEIFDITTKIQKEFPELYKTLMETPLASSYRQENISNDSLREYLESIKIQFLQFQELKKIQKDSQVNS